MDETSKKTSCTQELKSEIFKTESNESVNFALNSQFQFTNNIKCEPSEDTNFNYASDELLEIIKFEIESTPDYEDVKIGYDMPFIYNNENDQTKFECMDEKIRAKQEYSNYEGLDLGKIKHESIDIADSNYTSDEGMEIENYKTKSTTDDADVKIGFDAHFIYNSENDQMKFELMEEKIRVKQERSKYEGSELGKIKEETSDEVDFNYTSDERLKIENYDIESTAGEVPFINNVKECYPLNIEFTEETLQLKHEDTKTEEFELDKIEDRCGAGDISSEEDANEIHFGSEKCNHKSTIRIVKTRPSSPHVQTRNGGCQTAIQSAEQTRVYSDAESHTCATCKYSFRIGNCLIRHERSCNGGRPYQSTVCNQPFTQSASLTKHKRRHSSARRYKCTVCNKTFTQSSGLTKHKRIHSDDRPCKCTFCNKAFTGSSNLVNHKRIHTGGDRPYKCAVCNKTFTGSSGLSKHKRIHSGDRPYKCTVCNKAFTESSSLTKHTRIHSGDRPYKCTICNQAFTESSGLSKHKRIHSSDRPYKCTGCNKTFKFPSILTRHKRLHCDDSH